MFIFGHLGFGQFIARPWHERLSWWGVALGSLLPDLVDKPLFYLLPQLYAGSRLYGHTLIFLCLVSVVGLSLRSKIWVSIAIGVTTHLLIDNLGDPLHVENATDASIRTLLWPIFGRQFPDALRLNLDSQIHRMFNPYFLTTELIGLAFLTWYAWQRYIRDGRR